MKASNILTENITSNPKTVIYISVHQSTSTHKTFPFGVLFPNAAANRQILIERFTEDMIVEQLTKSMEKSDQGETIPAGVVSQRMREKYVV